MLTAQRRPPGGAPLAPLDLHEGIVTPADPRTGCLRWPEHLKILNRTTGELFEGRCRATNRCAYCARLFAVETSEMLLLDAMEDAPTLYVVLTARNLIAKPACRAHLFKLRKSLRARWPNVRWAVLVEFQKRGALHLNLMVKGVPAVEVEDFHAEIARLWCARPGVDAELVGQWAEAMNDTIGVVQYVTLHFMKPGQAPPIGWRGHRYSCSRDYLVRPASVMRVEAKRSLRIKRALHAGVSLEVAEQRERNPDVFELWTDGAKAPGAEPGYTAAGRARAARARSSLAAEYRDYLRGDLFLDTEPEPPPDPAGLDLPLRIV